MAAQRLGSILTNVTGTSNQILRVNTAETGFEFVAPASIPAYTITNETTDRVMDANDVTMDKVADILGTLIEDLAAAGLTGGGGVSAFTWSTSEQVWPFEKASGGGTLYAKQIDFGTLPNNGTKTVAHNISGLTPSKVHMITGVMFADSFTYAAKIMNLGWANHPSVDDYPILFYANETNVVVRDIINWSTHSATIKLIYAK